MTIDIEQAIGALDASGGRLDLAWEEVQRILRENLPSFVARINVTHKLNVDAPVAKQYWLLGCDLTEIKTPAIIVGMNVTSDPLAPGVYGDVATTAIYVLSGAASNQPDIKKATLLAQCARALMFQTNGGWETADGVDVWNTCEYKGMRALPPLFDKFFGWTLQYDIDQLGLESWSQSAI